MPQTIISINNLNNLTMNKQLTINDQLTETVHYTAEYAAEVMQELPKGCYIDKTICGCGMTTVALENGVNTIILVPTINLVTNKVAQYPNKRTNNVIFGVIGGVETEAIDEYVIDMKAKGLPIKLMVCYDSLWKVERYLHKCHLVIDESNKLLASSQLKSSSKDDTYGIDVVTKVFSTAEKFKDTVTFLSATPTPVEYLPKWVGEMKQLKITWSNTLKVKPILMQRTYPFQAVTREVIKPMKQDGFVMLGTNKVKKAIIFMNSVSQIVKCIKGANLDREDVAIIASDNTRNSLKIKGYNRLQDPTNLPTFTFVTSSGFEGIDLVDEEAISVVVSNSSKDFQMIDMKTDLKQAISRQRSKSNTHYGKFIYIYNQTMFSNTAEELMLELDTKQNKIVQGIDIYEMVKGTEKEVGFMTDDDFKAYTNFIDGTFILNENLFNADKYFILEVMEQYKKGFDVRGRYEEAIEIAQPEILKDLSYAQFVAKVRKQLHLTNIFTGVDHLIEYVEIVTHTIKLYNKMWSSIWYAKEMIEAYSDDYKQLILTVGSCFKKGGRYTNKEIKATLQRIYDEKGIERKAKAKDIYEFATVQPYKSGGIRGFEIINKTVTTK